MKKTAFIALFAAVLCVFSSCGGKAHTDGLVLPERRTDIREDEARPEEESETG